MKAKNLLPSTVLLICMMMFIMPENLSAQRISGSRKVESQQREVPYFNKVKVEGSIDLYLTQGEQFNVEVVADDNILEYIETEVNNEVLVVRLQSRVSLRNYKQMKVNITAPEFIKIQASGSSDIVGTGIIRQQQMEVLASGSSDISLDLEVERLLIECNGSSDAVLSGEADQVKATFNGSSDMKARNLQCQVLDMNFAGSSDATISVEKEVTGNLKGSSDVRIIGNPVMRINSSGSSSVYSGE